MNQYLRAYVAGVVLALLVVAGALVLGHELHVPLTGAGVLLGPAAAIALLKGFDRLLGWLDGEAAGADLRLASWNASVKRRAIRPCIAT